MRKPTVAMTMEEWHSVIDTNVTSMVITCQSFYEALKKSARGGRVVNIASLSSFVSLFEVSAYAASKAAVLSLTKSLAIEWAKDGINVNAIAPGVFPTELNSKLLLGTPRGDEFILRTPMKRFGKPEELVGACVLLASDAASFMTGECIAVDGGFLCSGVNV
jgi:NAD(P)-dependent dehydrogenase (short-subunit alcohol dehydrogenase family)